MRRTITIGVIAVLAASFELGGLAAADSQSDTRSGLARARQATHQYHDPALAEAHGFHATDECVELPDGSGGMGFHYLNSARIDRNLVIEEPEAVLYEPTGNGRKLVAIEYVVPDRDQDLSTDGDRPSLFGDAFDGPMPGHHPGMPIHYDQHVWVWEANPNGTFAQWNPNVHC